MAIFKVFLLVVASASIVMCRPQFLRAVPLDTHHATPVFTQVRTGLPSTVSHSHTTHTAEIPAASIVRAVPVSHAPASIVHAAQPLVHAVTHAQPTSVLRTVSHAQPATVVRTVAHAQPAQVVHTVAHAQPAHVVRTVAQPAQVLQTQPAQAVHAVAQPVQVVRTVAQPAAVVADEVVEVEVRDERPQYNFGYAVSDVRSGDSKTRQEERDGDVVKGSYSVADPDGRIRLVEYTADKEHGFQATVTYDGEPGPVAIPFSAPAAVASIPAVDTAQVVAVAPVDDEATIIDARSQEKVDETRDTQAVTQLVQNTPTILRTNVLNAVPVTQHVVQHAQPTVVRANAQHLVHAAQPTFLRLANGQFLSTHGGFVRALPVGTHLVHT